MFLKKVTKNIIVLLSSGIHKMSQSPKVKWHCLHFLQKKRCKIVLQQDAVDGGGGCGIGSMVEVLCHLISYANFLNLNFNSQSGCRTSVRRLPT